MYVPRIIDFSKLLTQKSYFLFGPRQTGKSTLIKETLPNIKVYNLLDSATLLNLSHSPGRLEDEVRHEKIVCVDEIQKLPELLNEVHKLIEKRGIHFLLTGSSARKLRRAGVNLLGGRARNKILHPFIRQELSERFDIKRALSVGLIPSIYLSDSPYEDLQAYAGNYLKEEIAAEGLVRSIPAFSRFLEIAALCNGKLINFTEIANDAQVPRTTIHEFFQILIDTLIANELPAWKKTRVRKPISTSKYYFFDTGVVQFLQHRRGVQLGSPEFGDAFETYIFHELRSYLDYEISGELHYWRSESGFEVDFILSDTCAIEVKAKTNISPHDLKGLLALKEEKKLKHYILVSFDQNPRIVNHIHLMPWHQFLDKLWAGELL